MNLVYYKLGQYDYSNHHFAYDAAGYFSDGWNVFPLILSLQGEILFEFNGSITDGDKAFLNDARVWSQVQAHRLPQSNKKIPSDVVIYAR